MFKFTFLLITLFFSPAPHTTQAEEAAGPCRADAKKFCSGVEPGGGRILACLKAHETALSPACVARMKEGREKFKAAMKEIHAACKTDAEKFCSGVEPGKGRIAQCLREHKAELSESCKSVGEKIRSERKKK